MESLNKIERWNIIHSMLNSNIKEKIKTPNIYSYLYNKYIKVNEFQSEFILKNEIFEFELNEKIYRHRFTCSKSYEFIKCFNNYTNASFNNKVKRHFLKFKYNPSEKKLKEKQDNLYYEKEAIKIYANKYKLIIKTAKSFINPKFPFIIGATDGYITENGNVLGIVEVKVPQVAKRMG